MKSKGNLLFAAFALLTVALLVLWQICFPNAGSPYLAAAGVMLLSLLGFFISYERSAPGAREVALAASLVALAVVSRAVFYLVPQFKPIAAVVVVSGACLGARRGYIVGALSAFLSNFIFGQGVWTPFQMAALGLVGFFAGLLFARGVKSRWSLALAGFALAFFVYGAVADLSSVLAMQSRLTLSGTLAVYIAGAPFSAAFGGATALFLFLFGKPLINKLSRVIAKYGILEG